MDKNSQEEDCAICLQKYHHPTQLPCGHIFCFLCVKGIAIQIKKCAMCRTQIPPDYFDHPVLVNESDGEIGIEADAEKYQWYYEGRNGWWKYDERSNIDLETAYNSEETECLLLLAGTIYIVDFQNMIQIRRNDATRRRRVKRDVPTLPSKGIAGIKKFDPASETASDLITNNISNTESEHNDNVLVNGDTTTYDTSNSGTTAEPQPAPDIEDIIESLRDIFLNSEDSGINSNTRETE